MSEYNGVEEKVIDLKRHHSKTWRDKPDWFWLLGLTEEVGELSLALIGLRRGPVEWELIQISAICMNWIEMRIEQAARAVPLFPPDAETGDNELGEQFRIEGG